MNEKCFFCGNECTKEYNKKDFVKKTFTNYNIIKNPASDYICDFCTWAFNSNSEIIMIDGEKRIGSPRNYSWIITPEKKIAFTKAHIKEIRNILLNINEQKFKIIISDSGQKHLLFRCDWAYSQDDYVIQFEEQKILINKYELKEYLRIVDNLSAVFGKVLLNNCDGFSYAISYEKYYGNIEIYEKWLKIKNKDISQLAIWLSKNQKESRNEFASINAG